MTERQLSRAVVRLAETLGWRVFVIQNTRAAALRSHTGVGWPDLFMVRKTPVGDARALAVELKVRGRKPTEAQVAWLDLLDLVDGIDAYIWTDRDWHDGTIESILRSRYNCPYDLNRVVPA